MASTPPILSRYENGNQYWWDSANGYPPKTNLTNTQARSLWAGCPIDSIASSPGYGQIYNFTSAGAAVTSNVLGGWGFTSVTSGAITLDATKGLKIDSGATTGNQGVNTQLGFQNWQFATNKPMWLEAQFQFTGMTTLAIQFLFGWAAAQTALIASGTIGTDAKVAFDGVPTTTGIIQTDTTASATTTNGTGFTIANNGTYVLGIYVDTAKASFYVNRVLASQSTTNLPSATALTPSIVVQSAGTVQPIVFMRWLRAVSLL